MIFGTDTARYQALGSYNPGAFEIINAQDPTVLAKIDRNKAEHRPWGLYVWVYPGQSGASLVDVAAGVIARAGVPPLGVWADYEDAGVGEWQLQQFFAEADRRGMKAGYYSNAHTVNHGLFLDRPWWYAAYPGNNDGSFPGLGAMRNPRPVHIWQYSSGGGLDRNVIVDEPWYVGFTGATPAPSGPRIVPEEDDVLYMFAENGQDIWRMGDTRRPVRPNEWTALKFKFSFEHGGAELKALPFDQQWWNDTPDVRTLVGGGGSGGPLSVTLSGQAVPA